MIAALLAASPKKLSMPLAVALAVRQCARRWRCRREIRAPAGIRRRRGVWRRVPTTGTVGPLWAGNSWPVLLKTVFHDPTEDFRVAERL